MLFGAACLTFRLHQTALDCGLNVIACIGESLEVREANKTLEVSQLEVRGEREHRFIRLRAFSGCWCTLVDLVPDLGTYLLRRRYLKAHIRRANFVVAVLQRGKLCSSLRWWVRYVALFILGFKNL